MCACHLAVPAFHRRPAHMHYTHHQHRLLHHHHGRAGPCCAPLCRWRRVWLHGDHNRGECVPSLPPISISRCATNNLTVRWINKEDTVAAPRHEKQSVDVSTSRSTAYISVIGKRTQKLVPEVGACCKLLARQRSQWLSCCFTFSCALQSLPLPCPPSFPLFSTFFF